MAIAFDLLRIGRFICIRLGHRRQAVRFAQPAPQVDRAAPLTAKGQGGRRAFFKLALTDGTAHDLKSVQLSTIGLFASATSFTA